MTPYQFEKHVGEWCERCKLNTRRGGWCPILAVMQRTPNDAAAMRLFRTGKCIQWEKKPERKQKEKTKGARNGKAKKRS